MWKRFKVLTYLKVQRFKVLTYLAEKMDCIWVSFRELDNSAEMKKILHAFCFIKYFGLYYGSDYIGFALLRLNVKEPTICYYDFEQQFSSTIKVKIPDLNCWKLKLCCSSIWILADLDFEDDIYKGIFIDVIGINSKIKWYHIRSNVSSPICLKSVFSGALLVADDLIDDINEDNDDFTDGVFFSSCKALYINQDNLIPFETNERNFIEIFKPKEFEMKNLLA